MTDKSMPNGLLRRVACEGRASVRLRIDGAEATALAGDTLLTAILVNRARLRESEFGDGPRAGFCMMGVCQDCWVSLEGGARVRACSTPVSEGMSVMTSARTGSTWLNEP